MNPPEAVNRVGNDSASIPSGSGLCTWNHRFSGVQTLPGEISREADTNGKLLFEDTVSPRSIHRARRISHRGTPENDPICRSMPGRHRLRAFSTYRYRLRTGRFDETERHCQFPAHTIEPRFHGRTLLLDTGLVSHLGLTSA